MAGYKAMQFERQSVMAMLGIPGSGKTIFAKQLVAETGAVLIDGDAICDELFPTGIYKTEAERKLLNDEYARRYEQALEGGKSVIRGNQHNSLKRREELSRTLGEAGIIFFIIWMQAPTDIANRRVAVRNQARPALHIRKELKEIDDNAQQILRTFNPPAEHELCVEIDGQVDFKDQLKSFRKFCEANMLT